MLLNKKFSTKFTIIDSLDYIEVHLNGGDGSKVCPRITKLIDEGIMKCAEVLHFSSSWNDLKYGFFCSCKHAVTPYEEDSSKAQCMHCSSDMSLTSSHTVWLATEGVLNVYMLSLSLQLFPNIVALHLF